MPIPSGCYINRLLYLQKHKITKPVTVIEIEVDEEPYKAGIDPYNKLIDRQPDDNTKRVKEKEGELSAGL